MSGFELMSHIKAVANKKAMIWGVVAFRARKNSPNTSGVKIKIAPSFAKTALVMAQQRVSKRKALRVFMAIFVCNLAVNQKWIRGFAGLNLC